jgi:hypothetical protein
MRDCGSRFARLDRHLLVMADGYAPDSRAHGAWKYSGRARAREAAGSKPRFRRHPINGGATPNSVWNMEETPLPIAVRCKKCGLGNVVTTASFGEMRVKVTLDN